MAGSEHPGITTIIPAYNAETYLSKAIESALSQDHDNCGVFVVDDGSTDNTQTIINNFRNDITWITQSNQGTSAAWNAALESVPSEFVLGLDADDELLPGAATAMFQAVQSAPEASVWYSDYVFMDHRGISKSAVINPPPEDPVTQLLDLHDHLGEPNNFMPFGHARLYRRSSLIEAGGFDPSYRYAEDYELMLRLASRGASFYHVPEVLYRYRWHTGNKGVLRRTEQINEVRRAVGMHCVGRVT